MENKFIRFVNTVDWKSVFLITATMLLMFLLPITVLTEQPTLVTDNQTVYSLRNNLITLIALIFRSSDNNPFFKSLALTPNFLALIIIIINIIFYSFLLIPYLLPLKSKRLKLFFLLMFITILILTKLSIYILLLLQKDSEWEVSNYVYVFKKIKLQPLYFLPLVGYIYYFGSLGWYLSKFIEKHHQK